MKNKSIKEEVLNHVKSALEYLEKERIDNGLGNEPTSGQEVLDYLKEKSSRSFIRK
jgi:hypothetical protein